MFALSAGKLLLFCVVCFSATCWVRAQHSDPSSFALVSHKSKPSWETWMKKQFDADWTITFHVLTASPFSTRWCDSWVQFLKSIRKINQNNWLTCRTCGNSLKSCSNLKWFLLSATTARIRRIVGQKIRVGLNGTKQWTQRTWNEISFQKRLSVEWVRLAVE